MTKMSAKLTRRMQRLLSTTSSPRRGRRAFLKGAGAVTLGLPFLELTSSTAHAAPGDHPQRLLILSMGHSMDVNGSYDDANLLPTHTGGVLDAMSPVLQPLAPHMSKVNYMLGIDNLVSQSLSSNGHNASGRTLLAYQPHAGAAFNPDGSLNAVQDGNSVEGIHAGPQGYPIGPSINYFIANQLGAAPLNLRVGGDHTEHARDFYATQNGSGETVILRDPCQQDPRAAFDSLFGAVGQPPEQTPQARLRRKQGSVLDAVLGQFNGLMNVVGADDRARLDRHATHIRELERQLDEVVTVTCEEPQQNFPGGLPTTTDTGEARADDLFFQAQLDVVRTAFACQSAQVAHIHFSHIQNNRFPFMNGGSDLFVDDNWHAVVHHDNGDGPQAVADRLLSYQWYSQCLAQAITAFEGVSEGEGTLMDNTLIVWLSSLRYSSHSTNNLPIVTAGDVQGQLHTGRFFDFNTHGADGATLGDLWTSVANIMLMPTLANGWNNRVVDAFGHNVGTRNGRAYQNGPLPGWLTSS